MKYIKLMSISLVILFVSTWAILFFIPLSPLLPADFSRAVYDENQHLLRLTLTTDGKYRLLTPLPQISKFVIKGTLLQEDQYFYYHPGINPTAFIKAIFHSYVIGPRRMGASTITMQLARIRYGINSKNALGKVKQIVRALQIEFRYTKAQILEAYLNLAPYGNNVEGIGAASLIYYGKPASELTLSEALTLVVMPQNPNKRISNIKLLQTVRKKLYDRWLNKYPADKTNIDLFSLPIFLQKNVPFSAPHFVTDVLSKSVSNQIVTTLNIHMQQTIERILRDYLSHKKSFNVNNAAVLLIDTDTMEIKALVGSANFFNSAIQGQVNGTLAKRSPGSTLKPFIYALSIDQGIIHPATVLKDVPHRFGSYNPENFDNDFIGPIKARDALLLSRNIPAIDLASQLHKPSLYEFLQHSNISLLKSETHYGLALALGGAELTLQELVSLYAIFNNQGIWQPLNYFPYHENVSHTRLISPEASFLLKDMLRDPVTNYIYKTGTSSGYRDAWTIGLAGHYVLGIWIGNFNNVANHAFIGKEIATPLFLQISHALPLSSNVTSTPHTLNLQQVEVCKASGLLPTRYCLDREKVWFIPGKSPIKKDTIHREIAINPKTGLRTCHFNENTYFEIAEFWPSDLLRIFKLAGIARKTPPPFEADCITTITSGLAPQIISPQSQVKYISRLSRNGVQVPLTAIVDADVRELHWFANASYIGKTKRQQTLFWQPKPGKYIIRVVDDFGRSDAKDLWIELEK